MTDETLSIWQRKLRIAKARGDKAAEAMRDYDDQIYIPAMKALREECAEHGHQWFFSNIGPLGDPWYCCNLCGAAAMRRDAS